MNVFSALADPTRAEIVERLAESPLSVSEVVGLFDISQPAISRHLRVLHRVGLVSVRPEGRRRIYRLEPAPLREIDDWLDRYRAFWSRRLDALERLMDEEPA
jgi:DNA-binding transcriptional ArsR family regulator